MTDIFISYARSTVAEARQVAEALRELGYVVWRDDELPAHRAYAEVIEERLKAAKAVVVIWSAEAVKSQWVRAEADLARGMGTLVQLSIDGVVPPMPFNQIQCADMAGWNGEADAPGWRKVAASVADLIGVATTRPVTDSETPLALPSKPSIAVMPFANLSGDPEQDYFADGMVEEITAALSRFKSIFVIASGSTLTFKGQSIVPQAVGRRLGVRYLLEGSVRKAGNRVRIAVKLLDTAERVQIWTDRFEDTLEDIFVLQDKVALSVAGVIEPTVREAEIRRVSKRPTENMGSYDLYLRAIPLVRALARADREVALQLLERAITLDPDYGRALAFAATTYFFHIREGWSEDPVGDGNRSIELAHRTLRVASDDPDVLAYAATALRMVSPEAASAMFERALALNPGSSSAWFLSGQCQARAGELDLAAMQIETSMRLDPLSVVRNGQLFTLGHVRFQQGRFGEAIGLLEECSHFLPHWPAPYAVLAACCGHVGQAHAGREALARFKALTPMDIHDWYATFAGRQDSRRLFRDGIAFAEGTG